jgi:hypothetical protein
MVISERVLINEQYILKRDVSKSWNRIWIFVWIKLQISNYFTFQKYPKTRSNFNFYLSFQFYRNKYYDHKFLLLLWIHMSFQIFGKSYVKNQMGCEYSLLSTNLIITLIFCGYILCIIFSEWLHVIHWLDQNIFMIFGLKLIFSKYTIFILISKFHNKIIFL